MTAPDLPAMLAWLRDDFMRGESSEGCARAASMLERQDAEIARLSAALAEAEKAPKGEPVAWMYYERPGRRREHLKLAQTEPPPEGAFPVYAAPPAAEPAALAAQQPAAVPALWQYRWTNPDDYPDIAPENIEWKEVKPASPLQSMEMRLQELRSYTFRDRPAYEVRALYVAGTTRQPLTLEYIDQHIGADEGDREAVIALVREVERAHNIGALAAAPAVQPAPDLTDKAVQAALAHQWGYVPYHPVEPATEAKEQPAEAVAPNVREALNEGQLAALEALLSNNEGNYAWELVAPDGDILSMSRAQVAALAAPTAAPSAQPVAVQVWCDTCEGTGQVHQESQRGVTGSGGTFPCPDCDAHGYVTRTYYRAAAPSAPQPQKGDAA